MRSRKPYPASLDEVTIRRTRDGAVVEFREPGIAVTILRLGHHVETLTDQQILECFNESLRDQAEVAESADYAALEIPQGRPQVEYFEPGAQWVPRGTVLRCLVDDTGPGGEAVVYIDETELCLSDFGKLLCTFSGWGMRICFVPEERLAEAPAINIGEPK